MYISKVGAPLVFIYIYIYTYVIYMYMYIYTAHVYTQSVRALLHVMLSPTLAALVGFYNVKRDRSFVGSHNFYETVEGIRL